MRCASCGGDMEYNSEKGGFTCPFCGASEKPEQEDLSKEEVKKLIDDAIQEHTALEPTDTAHQAGGKRSYFLQIIGFVLTYFLAAFALIFALFGLTSEKRYIPLGILALIQMSLFIAALIVRGINRLEESKTLTLVVNLLTTIGLLMVLPIAIVITIC